MSLTKKVAQTSDAELNTSSKATKTLNPNAAEFIPFSLRSPASGITSTLAATTRLAASSSAVGKAVLDRSESSTSRNSDEDAHQFWNHQLPDDITPDFKVLNGADPQGLGSLSLAGLSLHDSNETSRFSAPMGGGYVFPDQLEVPSDHVNGNNLTEKIRYSISSLSEDRTQTNFLHVAPKPWDKQMMNVEQLLGNGRHSYSGSLQDGLMNDTIDESANMGDINVNPVEFLASQFPGFSAESLAEVYFANGCDLHLTIEMLTQLELQVDGGLNQNLNSKALSAPNLSTLDFPALTAADSQNISVKYTAGDDFQQTGNLYQSAEKNNMLFFKSSSSFPSRGGPVDFATAVKKLASQDSGVWKSQGNGSVDSRIGSSRNSHSLAGAFSSPHGRSSYGEKLQNRGSARSAPVWVETGDTVANMYSELREEARDHARLRNAYFEQARQAYLIGNKALAKDLSVKGQLHNMQMKAAHGKAQESIYCQRNPVGPENVRGNERMIDLHGLHVSEAILVLKHELSVLRSTARAADQRIQVFICVGTGHHTRGSRTPARLPIAVQRYLLEEEGLDYTEPQAGLLRVVVY